MATTSAFMSEVIEAAFDTSGRKLRSTQPTWQKDIDRLYSYLEDEHIARTLAALEQHGPAAHDPATTRITTLVIECTVCTEMLPYADIATLPCSHRYCRTCIVRLFQDGMKPGAPWPPHCCTTEIPLPRVQSFLGARLTQKVAEKNVEMADRNPTYCVGKRCGGYVPAQTRLDATRQCAKCKRKMCTVCKERAHWGKCSELDGLLVGLAQRQKWKRCPKCKHMVEKIDGCDNLRCRCGCSFCYGCGHKTCRCF